LKRAAKLAGISHKKIRQLNSGYKGTSTLAPYKLVLPIENVEQFSENLARSILSRPVNWIHYKVKPGDTLLSISKKFNTTSDAVRKMNHMKKNLVHKGMNLLIPGKGARSDELDQDTFAENELLAYADEDEIKTSRKKKINKLNDIVPVLRSAHTVSKPYKLHPGDTIYMVRANDTIWKIANHFHISSRILKSTNQLSNNKLNPGKQLFIPTHLKNLAQKNASPANVQPGDTVYMIRRGDTIEKIARKFKITASAIRMNNLVDNHSLIEGENLVIPHAAG